MDLEKVNVEKEVKIVFMGTPEFAVPILNGILENYQVRAIITQPDKKVGRENKIIFSPIKKVGMEKTVLVLQPNSIKDAVEEIRVLQPDLIITCAYGQILPSELLKVPRLGCINVHASLLPKFRGGAPIHRAIMEGATQTGVTIMYMNEGMDEGDIISQKSIAIEPTDTASSLHNKLSILGRDLLLETLPSIIAGTNSRIKQDSSEATYGFVIRRVDERISFSKTKRQVHNLIRGLYSWPGAYCLYEGKILKIWKSYITENYFPEMFDGQITAIYKDGFGVKVSNGEVVFTEVQLEGKTRMKAIDFVHGVENKEALVGKVLD